MKLSIVTTLYQSVLYIEEFCHRAAASAQKLVGDDYEIVLVNDGSPDNSIEIAVEYTKADSHIVLVDLSRNFGHHKAMMTGLAYAQGDRVFLIDIDLEEEPEWLLSFSEQMEMENCEVVYGIQEKRKGGCVERWSGELFYRLFRMLTRMPIPQNIVTARLMTRRYVDALLKHQEREVMIAGLWLITGFEQRAKTVKKLCNSETTYTFSRKISVLVNSVTSFSNAPLKGIFYFGTGISIFAVLYISYLVFNRMFLSTPLTGWTSVMASVWLLGGLTISFIGIVGIYLSKVFSETKQRPYTIVRQVYGRQKESID